MVRGLSTKLSVIRRVLLRMSSPLPPIHTYSAITLFCGIRLRKELTRFNDLEFIMLYGLAIA